jgi:hypothetical protein
MIKSLLATIGLISILGSFAVVLIILFVDIDGKNQSQSSPQRCEQIYEQARQCIDHERSKDK